MRLVWFALLAPVLLLAPPTSSRADWPMPRHDAHRTATGSGTGRITQPSVSMRYYLGGSLGGDQYVSHDVDGDGSPEVVLLMGGALVAKTPADRVVWETPSLDAIRIDGVVDLDGIGGPEIVVSSRGGRVHVIDPRTGAVRWSLPSGIIGNVGAVRFAAFDDAPGLELYVADQGCGSSGSQGDVAEVYSFRSGLASPTRLFALERRTPNVRDYNCGLNDTLVDLDGDGRPEIVAVGTRYLYVYSGLDGSFLSRSDDIGSLPWGSAVIRLVQADDDAERELLCFREGTAPASANSRRVFLMDWDRDAERLVRRWQHAVEDVENDRHNWSPGGVEDLGGDGRVEVVTSFYAHATRSWTTRIYDVRDGSEVTSTTGIFRGLADIDGDGSSEVLVTESGGLSAFRFVGDALERILHQPGASQIYVRDRDDPTWPSAPRSVPLTIDLDGNGRAELLVSQGGALRAIELVDDSETPLETASLAVEEGISLSAYQVFRGVTRPGVLQPLVVRSDGYLWILDESLRPTNATEMVGEFPQRGMRVGGYSWVPVAADLDGDGSDDIVVRNSRGRMLRLDARDATLITPPIIRHDVAANAASLVDLDGDGQLELVVGTGTVITALRADGTQLWRRSVASGALSRTGELAFGDVSGDGTPDIVYRLISSSTGHGHANVLDGRNGAPLWANDFEMLVTGSGWAEVALHDRDGDGRLDVLTTPRGLFVWLSAIDGANVGQVSGAYAQHGVFFDLDGDGDEDIFTSGPVHAMRAFGKNLEPRWTHAAGSAPHTRVFSSAVRCGDAARIVGGRYNSPRLTAWSGADGEALMDVALRDGRRWEDLDAVPDTTGLLGNVTIAPNLVADGVPTALVPSTDGYLYAVDACTLELQWALNLRYPVSEAILADPDGDGEDEIIVTSTDGFLTVIDQQALPAPSFVYENDCRGPALSADDDIDEQVSQNRICANWAAVDEAIGYEYAIITPGGAFLTAPPFAQVESSVTSVSVDDLPLQIGQTYHVAVRALGARGTSSEALSDGVTVVVDRCRSCGPDEICMNNRCVPDPCAMGACETPDAGLAADAGPPEELTTGGCCSVGGMPTSRHGRGAGIAFFALVATLRWRRRGKHGSRLGPSDPAGAS